MRQRPQQSISVFTVRLILHVSLMAKSSNGTASHASNGTGTTGSHNELRYRRSPSPSYRVYHWRWLLLTALFVLSASNGMLWLTYSPIPNLTASFYRISVDDVDWFSNSYFTASVIMGFLSIWVLDTFQLRVAIISGALLNLAGAVIRYISTIPFVICSTQYTQAGFWVAMAGQVITACAQPFFLYAPAKLANTWFKPEERSICTAVGTLANLFGIVVSQLIAPEVVKTTTDLPTLLWILIIPPAAGALLSLVYILSKPAVPPAPSGDIKQEPFFKGIFKAMTNRNFLVLLVVWGLAAGGFCTFIVIFPQYLCPMGYSNQEVGVWVAVLMVCGLLGAVVFGLIIDKTKLFKEAGVAAYSMASLSIITFINLANYPNLPVPIAVSLCLFGLFALPLFPVCLELGVEVTYPVAEATSSGLLWSVAQFISMVMLLVSSLLLAKDTPPISEYNQCGATGHVTTTTSTCLGQEVIQLIIEDETQDWTYAGIFIVAMMLLGYFMFALMFKADYKRSNLEKKVIKKGSNQNENCECSVSEN